MYHHRHSSVMLPLTFITSFYGTSTGTASTALSTASNVPRKTKPPRPIHSVRGMAPLHRAPRPSCRAMCSSVGRMRALTPSARAEVPGDLCVRVRCQLPDKRERRSAAHPLKHDPRLDDVERRRSARCNGARDRARQASLPRWELSRRSRERCGGSYVWIMPKRGRTRYPVLQRFVQRELDAREGNLWSISSAACLLEKRGEGVLTSRPTVPA